MIINVILNATIGRFDLSHLQLTLALLGTLIVAVPNYAEAQQTSSLPSPREQGIQHVLYLSISSDPGSRNSQQNSDEAQNATITVQMRISAHSRESSFFGHVPATIKDFDPNKGSRHQEVWRDDRCHHERGYPKITVTSVDGSITRGQQKQTISARDRRLGLFLPKDEVTTARRLDGGTDEFGPFLATRTETKQSHLMVDLKLYILPCDLYASGN